ncbi:MAG: hypothetical protein E7K72_26205 [Roseomonas mucosa]|nr:hypothetical protein [Roseomonas mucosa]
MSKIVRSFDVEVPGVGTFIFRRRNLADQIWIESEAHRMTGGATLRELDTAAMSIATIQRLATQKPPGFDLDEMDPLDPATQDTLRAITEALRPAEDKFFGRDRTPGAEPGTGAVQDA